VFIIYCRRFTFVSCFSRKSLQWWDVGATLWICWFTLHKASVQPLGVHCFSNAYYDVGVTWIWQGIFKGKQIHVRWPIFGFGKLNTFLVNFYVDWFFFIV
jgi:hypothetical protein